jgi:hypothetical protein
LALLHGVKIIYANIELWHLISIPCFNFQDYEFWYFVKRQLRLYNKISQVWRNYYHIIEALFVKESIKKLKFQRRDFTAKWNVARIRHYWICDFINTTEKVEQNIRILNPESWNMG